LETRFVNQTNCPTGVGFNLLHDFPGLMDVAAMQGVDLGQFDP